MLHPAHHDYIQAHTKANIAEGSVAGHNLEGSLEASSTVPFGSR